MKRTWPAASQSTNDSPKSATNPFLPRSSAGDLIRSAMSDRYVIRTMSQPQVAMAIDWAAQEGWNPGWHDAA
jgi:hypothetical protein